MGAAIVYFTMYSKCGSASLPAILWVPVSGVGQPQRVGWISLRVYLLILPRLGMAVNLKAIALSAGPSPGGDAAKSPKARLAWTPTKTASAVTMPPTYQ